MPQTEPGSEEVEVDEESEEAEPWRGFGRTLEGMLGGFMTAVVVVRISLCLVCCWGRPGLFWGAWPWWWCCWCSGVGVWCS